jgi:dTMP kinase
MKRGLFITFEGIDGCGKSTQAKMLADYIFNLSKYNHVLKTREPFESRDIRKILQADPDPYSQGLKLAEMFVEDRKAHLKELIIPSLEKGVHVVSDRYDFSTLAYQQTQGIELTKLIKMHEGLLFPDITFIVDTSVEIAIERMKKDLSEGGRETEQKFEKHKGFMEKLRANYINLPYQINGRLIYCINGEPPVKEIFELRVKPFFDSLYRSYSS